MKNSVRKTNHQHVSEAFCFVLFQTNHERVSEVFCFVLFRDTQKRTLQEYNAHKRLKQLKLIGYL